MPVSCGWQGVSHVAAPFSEGTSAYAARHGLAQTITQRRTTQFGSLGGTTMRWHRYAVVQRVATGLALLNLVSEETYSDAYQVRSLIKGIDVRRRDDADQAGAPTLEGRL